MNEQMEKELNLKIKALLKELKESTQREDLLNDTNNNLGTEIVCLKIQMKNLEDEISRLVSTINDRDLNIQSLNKKITDVTFLDNEVTKYKKALTACAISNQNLSQSIRLITEN